MLVPTRGVDMADDATQQADDDPSTRSPQPASRTAPPRTAEGDVDVLPVLGAFTRLQMRSESIVKAVAAEYGLGTSDLRALTFVHAQEGVTPKQVSEYLDLSSGATTSLIDRMAAHDYVERRPHPTDRRSSLVAVAPAGRAVVDAVLEFYTAAFRDAVDPFYLEFFENALRALESSLSQHAEQRHGPGA